MSKVRVVLDSGLFFELEGKPSEACFIQSNFKDEADPAEAEVGFMDALDGVESLILSLHCAGFDVTTDQFKGAVQSTLDAIENNYSL